MDWIQFCTSTAADGSDVHVLFINVKSKHVFSVYLNFTSDWQKHP